ncbi:MAG: hypothetical protein ACRDK0_11890 [Solirubrobacteraceae bacterium]
MRERKVAARLREIARDRRALRGALDRFAGGEDFARVWASEDPDEINRRDQVERPYERIVNDLQEIIDFCEAEETERGSSAPEGAGSEDPGRWRRVALRGHFSHAQAERWQSIVQGRQRLAHHYADLPARHGAEIYERAEALLWELPKAVGGLGRWIEELWPA